MENINFAQTFKPEKQYICSILKAAKDNSYKTLRELSLETGIPTGESSGKVLPHMDYAKYMGLIDYTKDNNQYSLTQTELGKTVSIEDANLMETLTILLLHLMIVRKENGAPIWNKMFSIIIPKYMHEELSIDNAIKELSEFYDSKINKRNFSPFINSYKDLFKSLKILDSDSNNIIVQPNNDIENDFVYVYMYAILLYWEETFPNRLEITADEFEQLNFSNNLLCNSETQYSILELLSDKNLISLNRQLTPYTIVLNTTKEATLEMLYSELL